MFVALFLYDATEKTSNFRFGFDLPAIRGVVNFRQLDLAVLYRERLNGCAFAVLYLFIFCLGCGGKGRKVETYLSHGTTNTRKKTPCSGRDAFLSFSHGPSSALEKQAKSQKSLLYLLPSLGTVWCKLPSTSTYSYTTICMTQWHASCVRIAVASHRCRGDRASSLVASESPGDVECIAQQGAFARDLCFIGFWFQIPRLRHPHAAMCRLR